MINPGETGQTRCQGEAEGGGPHEGGEWRQQNRNKDETQVNEKRGDVEAKFRPEGMNGNGVAGGKAQHNGTSHAGGAGAYPTYILYFASHTVLVTNINTYK